VHPPAPAAQDGDRAAAAEHLQQDRRARFAAHVTGAGRAIGVPHPYRHGIIIGETHRPGIAETVRRAGLEADGALGQQPCPIAQPSGSATPSNMSRRYQAATGPKQPMLGASGASAITRSACAWPPSAMRHRAWRYPTAKCPIRPAPPADWARRGWECQMRAGILQRQGEGQRADPFQHHHGGNIQ